MIILKLLNIKTNDLAYLGYDRSYDRNAVIVLATDHLRPKNMYMQVHGLPNMDPGAQVSI